MKHAFIIPMLFPCMVAFSQQKGEIFSVSPEQPKKGATVTVSYNTDAPGAKLKDASDIDLYALIFLLGDDPLFLDKPMKKENNKWIASFQLTDGKSSLLAVRCVSKDQSDDNNDNGFDVMLYGDDGRPVMGAHQARAVLLRNSQYFSFKHARDLQGAIEEIRKEKDLYPDNWRASDLFLGLMYQQDNSDAGKAKLKPDLDKHFYANKSNDEALSGIVRWYRTLGDSATADQIEKTTIATNPNGKFERQTRWNNIFHEQDPSKRIQLIQTYLNQFSDLETKDRENKLEALFYAYIEAKDYDKASVLLAQFKNPSWNLYNGPAWGLIEKGQELERAVEWAKKGVDLSRTSDPDSRKYYATLIDWENGNKYGTGAVLDTYAYGLLQLGKPEEAEKNFAEAYDLTKGGDPDINARYLESMIKNKHYDKAYEVGLACLKNGKSNDKLLEDLKACYAAKEGLSQSFSALPQEKQKKFDDMISGASAVAAQEMRKKVLESRISKPSIDFTLKDLQGTPVTLSALKGKVVVVDFWATWCGPCKASFPYLQKVYEKYKGNDKIVILALDTWEHVKEYSPTVDNAKKFMEDNKYTFPVLIDEVTGKKVAEKYEVEGIPTKFIIDKKGNIAFKSVGFSGPEMVEELTQQIELLLGESIGSLE